MSWMENGFVSAILVCWFLFFIVFRSVGILGLLSFCYLSGLLFPCDIDVYFLFYFDPLLAIDLGLS